MAQLLDTKLRPPPLGAGRVHRPRMFEHLSGLDGGVVIVSAPPGFGKSTCVVEWLSAQQRPFAWYSLDRYDDDVGLFSEYVARAIGDLTGAESGLVSLPGDRAVDVRTLVATLVEDLARGPSGAVLVLDDYHEVRSHEVHTAVRYLVDNLPDGVVLVIISRADPPLPLSRLRAQGRLREIRARELRFTEPEVAEYFSLRAGLDLNRGQVALIVRRSEGWVAALELVRLGLDPEEPSDPTASLSAEHPFIAGYLVDEVMQRLRPQVTRFLLDSSSLTRFDAELCGEVTGTPDAASMLDELGRQNTFLIPLGDGWYRYHHLFAELLRSQLRRSNPDRQDELRAKAAATCDRRGLTEDAIDYALQGEDLQLAASIVGAQIAPVLAAGEVARLRSWLRLFPVPAGAAEAVLILGWAWCRVFEGDPDAAGELLDRLETEQLDGLPDDWAGQVRVMRAITAFQGGDAGAAEMLAEQGLAALPRSSSLEGLGQLYVGRALHAQARREEARPRLERAATLAQQRNALAATSALFWLGVTEMDQGELVAAERSMLRSQEAGRAARGRLGEPGPAAGIGDMGVAYVRLNQLDARGAIAAAERGTRQLQRSTFVEMVFRAFFVWAEALSVGGRHGEAQAVAEEGIDWLRGRSLAGGPLETWMWMAQARNSWRQGRMGQAEEMLQRVRRGGLGSPNRDERLGFYEAADAASHALRLRDVEASRRLLAAIPADPGGNAMFAIKRQVLTAALHEVEGEPRAAVASLEEAVDLAQQGYRYQFSFVGPVIRPSLRRLVGRSRHDDFVRSLLERLPDETQRRPEQPLERLTDREVEVLAEIAAGYTNEQIADRLFISRGTVKRHTSNIYLKLGAHHRAEATAGDGSLASSADYTLGYMTGGRAVRRLRS